MTHKIAHLVIDANGPDVFGEGEWKVKKHGKAMHRVWKNRPPAVDADIHEVISTDLPLNNVKEAEALPGGIRQNHRKIKVQTLP